MATTISEKVTEKKTVSRAKAITSQLLACLALDFLLIGLGMSISFVTMVQPAVMNVREGLSITTEQASWFGSIAYLCQPLGSVFSGPLLDYFGRKKALFIVNIPHIVAWLLMYFAWDVPSLFLGNALLGIGTGIMEAPSVTYVGEISEPSIRGLLTTMTNAFTAAGMFLAYLLGGLLGWRHAALVSLAIPLTTMVTVLFVPETPIWLLSKGRQKEALQSLCTLRGWAKPEEVKQEFDELVQYNEVFQQCVVCIKQGKTVQRPCEHDNTNVFRRTVWKFQHVFLEKETMRPFMLVIAYFFFNTMSGFFPLKPNLVNACKALGMKYDAKTVVVIAGALFIPISVISAFVVKVIGKRKLILSSLLATSLLSLVLSIYAGANLSADVFSYDVNTFPERKDILPVVIFMLWVSFYAMGIPWVLLSEVFPFRSRGMATGLAAASAYVIFFLATKTNYNIEAQFHLSGSLAIYSSIGIIGTIYLYFFLPETESKTLVEIEAFYKGDQKIFADDFFINCFRKKRRTNKGVDKPMLVKLNKDSVA